MKNHEIDGHIELSTSRLEAFSDAVMAIIITISVLAFRIPEGASLSSLLPLVPVFFTYLVSFQTIGTYWNNHHHLLRATKHVSASMMWANLHLLFWLSIIPFATGWLGENHSAPTPTAFYAGVLLCAAFAYLLLQEAVIFHSEKRVQLRKELFKQKKGLVSLTCYALAIPLAFVSPIISDILIVAVSLMWFIPDRRIERALGDIL
jgi:uncharacterized membrane protein